MTDDMTNNDAEPVILVDEDGVEHEFIVIDVIEMDDSEYAILQPTDDDPDDDIDPEAIILRFDTDDDGQEVLVEIEDDDEWEKVADAWQDFADSQTDG